MITRQYKTPCGTLTLGAINEGLCLCVWNNDPHKALKERKSQRLLRTASAVTSAEYPTACKAYTYATASAAMRTTTEEAIKADTAVTFSASAADKASAAALTCLSSASRQLDEYFAGTRTTFDIPLHMAGTEFQKRVWQQLLKIQYGTTTTYKQIAERISKQQSEPIEKQTASQIAKRTTELIATTENTSSKTASVAKTAAATIAVAGTAVQNATTTTMSSFICRAVANACAANPISIIIPCHRVIGSNNNNLTGYAGGLSAKKKLLEIEGGLL